MCVATHNRQEHSATRKGLLFRLFTFFGRGACVFRVGSIFCRELRDIIPNRFMDEVRWDPFLWPHCVLSLDSCGFRCVIIRTIHCSHNVSLCSCDLTPIQGFRRCIHKVFGLLIPEFVAQIYDVFQVSCLRYKKNPEIRRYHMLDSAPARRRDWRLTDARYIGCPACLLDDASETD